ncbi:penicillin acylase family protein [Marinitenerispora sediminis]|uniref:Penicillin acylase n=1 Tax=Marinitenerispora sediminis TaxID=1931232 RepID=A0A368T785_9ACTN|nr:penicillin acylase family protein [Marinitenerispora sediminis]RCV54652.1 penicillin acylase [Marinitenerispora sediminis]RCV56410.1 penicillin acylase [Marinitenerispora sediminis]RCV59754.1 penicillin acylase [Marinitenerispora sediminis]
MVRRPRWHAAAAAGTAVICLATGAATAAPAAAEPAGRLDAARLMAAVEDYCGDGCHDILAPGQNGNATLVEILGHQLFGTRPQFSDTQLAAYDGLLHGYDDLTGTAIDDYFLDASFGVPADEIGSQVQPRFDVTIVRDRRHGIPHVYGTTRAGTMYGAGYAAAQDRLFLMDLLRNLGRGQLTAFAGGAESNQALEQSLWRGAPYTEADKQAQIDRVAASGERGAQALADVESYVEGINAYIDRAEQRRDYPGEYVLTGHKDAITQAGEIEHFGATDVVGIAAMVGLLFGGGGGDEVRSALVRAGFWDRYGPEDGERIWRTWRMENDPEAVVTAEGEFPYTQTPDQPVGEAVPDPGSVVPYDIVRDRSGAAATGAAAPARAGGTEDSGSGAGSAADLPEADQDRLAELAEEGDLSAAEGVFNDGLLPGDLLDGPPSMSNALVVSGEHTESGHPVSVAGPQTGYYLPQLLLVQELQGPGISARGASFPGVSFYVQIGRGADYSWSPTSAGQDITDTFAVELCEPGGGTPTVESRHYRDGADCVALEELSVYNEWSPTVADQTPAGSYTLTALRSRFGLVDSFGTVDGVPVAFATRRSTYLREVDSIIGFQKFNDPGAVRSAADFQNAAMDIGYAFNWHYADDEQIAYVNSGANPVRTPGTNPNLPISADSAAGWAGWDPETNGADYTPLAEHPNSRDADYYVNWNNKPAAGYTSGYATGSVHRGDLLDERLRELVAADAPVTPAALVAAMQEAATVDLRGDQVLPELLRVLDSAPVDDPALAAAVEDLRAWQQAGATRRETAPGSGEYAHADAIRTMDAWWPLLVRAQFEPGLGTELYEAVSGVAQVDESPSGQIGGGEPGSVNQGQAHKGSSFQYGWWSYVDKDLRTVLGDEVAGPLGTAYCGGGELDACRAVLLDALAEAAAAPATEVYPGDAECAAGDQVCADSVVHAPLGGVTVDRIPWQNRPTYQAVHEFYGGRG